MKLLSATLVLFFVCAVSVFGFAQHGQAPSGYWPMGYAGDMFTGEVTNVNVETREITLTYKNGEKAETFVGVLVSGLTSR